MQSIIDVIVVYMNHTTLPWISNVISKYIFDTSERNKRWLFFLNRTLLILICIALYKICRYFTFLLNHKNISFMCCNQLKGVVVNTLIKVKNKVTNRETLPGIALKGMIKLSCAINTTPPQGNWYFIRNGFNIRTKVMLNQMLIQPSINSESA